MKYLNETGLAHLWASLKTLLQGKQDKLTAGTGIDISVVNGQTVISINLSNAEEGSY